MKRALNTTINCPKSVKNDEYYVYAAKSRLVSGGFATEQKASLQHSRYSAISQLHNSTIAQFSNVYDHLDRRVQKITPEATHSFFYDGWMLVKEVVANTNGTIDLIEYHWGNDLSCSRGGAAGKTSACGDDPAAFPIRFSTKYHDIESGLYYYCSVCTVLKWLFGVLAEILTTECSETPSATLNAAIGVPWTNLKVFILTR